jgi:hypothetical protein
MFLVAHLIANDYCTCYLARVWPSKVQKSEMQVFTLWDLEDLTHERRYVSHSHCTAEQGMGNDIAAPHGVRATVGLSGFIAGGGLDLPGLSTSLKVAVLILNLEMSKDSSHFDTWGYRSISFEFLPGLSIVRSSTTGRKTGNTQIAWRSQSKLETTNKYPRVNEVFAYSRYLQLNRGYCICHAELPHSQRRTLLFYERRSYALDAGTVSKNVRGRGTYYKNY